MGLATLARVPVKHEPAGTATLAWRRHQAKVNDVTTCVWVDMQSFPQKIANEELAREIVAVRRGLASQIAEQNGGFTPLVVVFGRDLDPECHANVVKCGALAIDLALPGNARFHGPEELLNSLDEGMTAKLPHRPATIADCDGPIAESPEIYYSPLTEGEEKKLVELLEHLNRGAQQDK